MQSVLRQTSARAMASGRRSARLATAMQKMEGHTRQEAALGVPRKLEPSKTAGVGAQEHDATREVSEGGAEARYAKKMSSYRRWVRTARTKKQGREGGPSKRWAPRTGDEGEIGAARRK